jgi:hypothetical protein
MAVNRYITDTHRQLIRESLEAEKSHTFKCLVEIMNSTYFSTNVFYLVAAKLLSRIFQLEILINYI